METETFLLIVLAAILHASWNFAAKRVAEQTGVIWLGVWFVTFCSTPFAVYYESIPIAGGGPIGCLLATTAFHAVYFSLIVETYKHRDISVVYPIAA